MIIEIGDKKYKVQEARTEEEKMKGLQNVKELDSEEGMLFIYDKPQSVDFWMKDTEIPLDIIFIDEDQEVISVHRGEPMSEDLISEDNVKYVLEVNQGSGIAPGDELELDDENEDDSVKMKVLALDGSTQMELEGGERIFSRKNTKVLIRLAKKAHLSKDEKDYKALGKRVFKYLRIQDNNEPEYVDAPDKN